MNEKIKNKLRESLQNLSEEDIHKYFPVDSTPKGWLDIEDYLPKMKAVDIMNGGTTYKVKCKDGTECYSIVGDHNSWYYDAKENGITHWFNE